MNNFWNDRYNEKEYVYGEEPNIFFADQLNQLNPGKIILPCEGEGRNTKNSAGFLIRHIGDVELLFAKNVFGAGEVKVSAKTMIAQHDTGEWTNLQELLEYQQYAFDNLKAIIEKQTDEIWQQNITTKEFGTKTKAEAIGRIISHTAYHAGQLAIILKYGK